ncbi:MAG: gliding motility protein GldM, partial [Muribaculaceae bacterium]|nr:gliding motility protein GldM [Muribaculaceae bacterium]
MATAKNQTVGRMSPRQKMINLMYIVLTAMLALNVSSEVMNGFTQVQSGLLRSNRTITARNQAML